MTTFTPDVTSLRQLGRTDLRVPPLCLGTMMYGEQINEDESRLQMDACVERGLNFFDTAELYTIPPRAETQGESERIIGRWMKERGNRDDLIIATKVVGRSEMRWLRDGGEPRLVREQIIGAVERSLNNLQTDYIDLYQTHWPERDIQNWGSTLFGYRHFSDIGHAIGEMLEVMDELVKAGKIRHFGLSNETAWGTMRHIEEHKAGRGPRVVSIQNAYNLLNRTFETGLAEVAMEENVGLLAYSPLAQGAITGKYLDGAAPEGSRRALFDRLQRYESVNADSGVRAYLEVAKQLDVHPVILAMQFVTTRPFVTSNIFGARNMEQLDIILRSTEFEWTEEVESVVRNTFSKVMSPCP